MTIDLSRLILQNAIVLLGAIKSWFSDYSALFSINRCVELLIKVYVFPGSVHHIDNQSTNQEEVQR